MKTDNKIKTEAVIGQVSSIRDKANRLILELLRERGIMDVVPAYGGIFVHLFLSGEMAMGQIAKAIDRDKSTLTALVKKLTKLGYLKSRRDKKDGRVILLSLTEKGKALERDFHIISTRLLERVYTGFTEGEKMVLVELLARLKDNLESGSRID